MTGLTVRKPSCLECEFYQRYRSAVSQKAHGVTLHMGDQYCTGGKRYRRIKGKGKAVSDWCPKLKRPPELRIYSFKNSAAWYLHQMLFDRNGSELDQPSAHHYALRFQGCSPVPAWEFAQLLDEGQDLPDLGTAAAGFDVIEIDDGLKPYFFYKTDGVFKSVLFDRDVARKNKLERKTAEDDAASGPEGA